MTKAKFANDLMKMTTNGRRPQNIKSGISQQPMIGSYSKFKLKLIRQNQSFQMPQMKMRRFGDCVPGTILYFTLAHVLQD